MIPVRVLLRNFLCYAETESGQPIEFDFEGSPLWSISGDNGAGKSAIFDAITYTLFGKHRGGSQEDSRLIRKGSDRCEVTFEFSLDSQLYRARRTVSRPKGKSRQEQKTWQAAQFDQEINDWRPIKETERATYFDRWVKEKLGLRYETFIASIMLLQGQSDQLVSTKPKQRFDILSGLLDLEPYKRLETAAGDRMRTARAEVQRLDVELQNTQIVTQQEIEEAQTAHKESEQNLKQAQTEYMQAGKLVEAAQNYANLQQDLLSVQSTLEEMFSLLQDADRIRGAYQEWKQLSDALPKLRQAIDDIRKAAQQSSEVQRLESQISVIDTESLGHAVTEAERAVQQGEKQYETLRIRAEELSAMLPLLRDILNCRCDQETRRKQLNESGLPHHWKAEAARLQGLLQEQKKNNEKLEKAREEAIKRRAQAQAVLEQARIQLTLCLEVQSEAVCSRCGQKVDPEHIQHERAEAEQAVSTAQRKEEISAQDLQTLEHQVKEASFTREEISQKLHQARQSLAVAQQAEKEWQDTKAKLENAITVAGHISADILSVAVTGPLTEVSVIVQKLEAEIKKVKVQLNKADEHKKRMNRRHKDSQQAYQKALREQDQLHAETKRLLDGAQALRKQAEVRLVGINPHWSEKALSDEYSFIDALSQRHAKLEGIEQKFIDLEKAAKERERIKIELEGIKRNIERVQPEHRISEDEANARAKRAKQLLSQSQDHRDQASQKLHILEERQKKRKELEKNFGMVQRQRRLYTRLAELFGRNGLQSHLLDEAIQGIAQLANETLARISGGQLRIHVERLPSNRGEEEITIQITDLAFSEESIDAQFISGSQKFRVSVALAAGIGQYAGRGTGSIRSLIIDEGFGSLDSQGRQEMIDELRNLSQFIDRIIIVSHQEDFQDRTLFPTGYVLQKTEQSTRVEKFV